MNDMFKIIVYLLEHMLHSYKPLFGKAKKIEIFVSDDIRRCEIVWDLQKGARFYES